MDVTRYALVQGMDETRGALVRWRADPWRALRPWLAGALAVCGALLAATYVVARLTTPDSTPPVLSGVVVPGHLSDVRGILFRNSLVLALHGFACVAGFIAGSSLPLQAEHYRGWMRKLHDGAGRFAILFVAAATLFSLCTQAYVLGAEASNIANYEKINVAVLLFGLLPHAVPELVALFLPLAAWLIASRRDEWDELLAATFVTVGLAIPVLIGAAFVEVYISPHLIAALQ